MDNQNSDNVNNSSSAFSKSDDRVVSETHSTQPDTLSNVSQPNRSGAAEPSLSEIKDDVGIVSPQDDRNSNKKRKTAMFWNKFIRILTIKFIAILTLILFLTFFGISFAQAPLHALVDQLTKPKPITQSTKVLPADIQQAIQDKAQQQIDQQKATALVTTNTSGGSYPLTTQSFPTQQPSLLSNIVYPFQLLTATSPADKAKLRLRRIDQEIQQVESLLQSSTSDNVVNQAVGIIQNIGQETGQILADKNVQTDREVLTSQIGQYTRVQLTLQKVEDTLPIGAYLKIDGAREKYLVSGAQQAINTAPNVDVINAIGINETRKIVGSDFAELKAIETLTDNTSGLNPKAQQKLSGVQKELALQFEKRMLTLPPDVRTKKLQDYIALSYGNPLSQVQAFDQMQHFLTDREMILSVDALKSIALKRLENRIFEIKTQPTRDEFIALTFNTPQSLEVLAQVQLDTSGLTDATLKKQISDVITGSQVKIAKTLDSSKNLNTFFAPEIKETTSLLDTVVVGNLATVLESSPNVSQEVKTDIQTIQQKILENFISGVTQNNFLTTLKVTYNPVSENADVRILLPEPQAISLLQEVKSALPDNEKSVIDIAQKAESNILVDSLLTKVNDPQVFQEDKHIIDATPEVKQTLEVNGPQSFFEGLDKKETIIASQVKDEDQQLYETMQQITQAIFTTNNTTNEEKQLPQVVQTEIDSLKNSLVANEIPKLATPADVTLPKVAVLPSDIQDALITAAKEKIDNVSNKNILDAATEAKELGVSVPLILPDNPLYSLVELERKIALLVTTDPIAQAEELIKQDNEKTIEAAKLVEESKSTSSIETALQTLDSVSKDFDLLEQHVADIKQIEQTQPEKVDQLITQVIENGVARQTVLSSIESNIHGDAYVEAETIRQEILQDGVDTLLKVTDNKVQSLTDKLEKAVTDTTTPEATIESDIKAIEILAEIARTQPESVQTILQTSEANIATSLEKTLLTEPVEQRQQEIVTYAEDATGNPVRQLEAYDILKDNFTNPQTILLTEELKDKATQNLEERISEIPDANTQAVFADQIIGSEPQDLKAITQIETEIAPPQNEGIVEVLPIVQKIEDIKANIEENIATEFKDKPEELKNAGFFDNPILRKTPDVVDIQVAQAVVAALESSPEVQPEVITV